MGDKGDKSAARPPEGSLVETRCLIKGPKSAIVPFAEPRSGPKFKTGPGVFSAKSEEVALDADYTNDIPLLANTPTKAETMLHSVERAAGGTGLHVNAD